MKGHFLSGNELAAGAFERGKRTDIGPFNCGLRGPEAQSDVLVPSPPALSSALGLALRLVAEEDVRLFLTDVRPRRLN